MANNLDQPDSTTILISIYHVVSASETPDDLDRVGTEFVWAFAQNYV
jgi:hypothetical protein